VLSRLLVLFQQCEQPARASLLISHSPKVPLKRAQSRNVDRKRRNRRKIIFSRRSRLTPVVSFACQSDVHIEYFGREQRRSSEVIEYYVSFVKPTKSIAKNQNRHARPRIRSYSTVCKMRENRPCLFKVIASACDSNQSNR